MGGALAIASLANIPHFDCGVSFYGIPGPEMRDVRKPLQGHFGREDKLEGFSDAQTARDYFAELKKKNVPSELHLYDGVGHAFMNSDPHLRELASIAEPYQVILIYIDNV